MKEDIEIVYLTDETKSKNKKQFDFNKYKKVLIIVIPLLLIIIVGVLVYLFILRSKPVEEKNVIVNKEKIDTSLDLKGIFKSDTNYASVYNVNNLSKADIINNKIYFTYSPNYCIYESDNLKESNNLCNKYHKENSEYEDLNKRYIVVSNLDGENYKELEEYPLSSPLTLDYTDKNLALFYSPENRITYKIDYKKNEVTKVKDNFKVGTYPLSNGSEIVLLEQRSDLYTLNYYDYNDFSKTKKQIDIYYDNNNKETFRKDFKGDIYTMSNSTYDKTLEKDYNGVYKNGELQYTFRNDYKDFFVGGNFIYILSTTGYNIRLLKIDKDTLELHTPVIILRSNRKINNVEYLFTGKDNLSYINIDNIIYTFDEVNDNLSRTTISFNSLITKGMYNNFIYLYGKQKDTSTANELFFYNIVTKEEKVIDNVEYFKINDGELYTVENNEGVYELYKYDIN